MSLHESGYALAPGESLEEWEMGGDVLRLLVSAEQTRGVVSVIEGVARGGGPPLHVHDNEDEVVLVVAGRLAYRVGDSEGEIEPGGLLWMPRQIPHAIANLSAAACRFLTIAMPGGIEVLFRAQSRYLSSLPGGAPPDPDVMARLEGAETRRAVGPPLSRTR
jgi:quercetin dioxygenase-like cupin family protein